MTQRQKNWRDDLAKHCENFHDEARRKRFAAVEAENAPAEALGFVPELDKSRGHGFCRFEKPLPDGCSVLVWSVPVSGRGVFWRRAVRVGRSPGHGGGFKADENGNRGEYYGSLADALHSATRSRSLLVTASKA